MSNFLKFRPGHLWPLLAFAPLQVLSQCLAPATFGFKPPQTSTSFGLQWNAPAGVSQYQIQFWETAAPNEKMTWDGVSGQSATLAGLKKNTGYTMRIRSKCSNDAFSSWSAPITGQTLNSGGVCNNMPAGVSVVTDDTHFRVSWTSSGNHTICYRPVNTSDWIIPAGALFTNSSPFNSPNLPPGEYQIAIKRNCSSTTGAFVTMNASIGPACPAAISPFVTPQITQAVIELPVQNGVSAYHIEYKLTGTSFWISAGTFASGSICVLNPPLQPGSNYTLRLQAICANGTGGYSPVVTFTTLGSGNCLNNKDAGKNMSSSAIAALQLTYNKPSPFSFNHMIGVNDGGLVFRSFQWESYNQITDLTKQFRNFHTMDEDYDPSLSNYASNIKPRDVSPEGVPTNMGYNKGLYTKYRELGFLNIVAATELLQYQPLTWKEKIYNESDWSSAGPGGIRNSYRNYTAKFIDEMAPIGDSPALVTTFQVGNEPWDYPVPADYHSLLLGAHDAFVTKYGPKSEGKWKMKLAAAAFQAYRSNTCSNGIRDFSNCGASLDRFDHVGDHLNVLECDLLRDLDAVDCHPYSFKPGTNHWTYPEDPLSETWQIRNLAAWLDANKNTNNGILVNTRLWSSEFGFDSNPETGVGERTQSLYLLRGLLMHSRYHYEKVFFYNAYDVARTTDPYYNGLYNSSGFWKLGTHPQNSAWPSPLIAHGAQAKPAWYGMLDFKARFGEHVFTEALVESNDLYVYVLAKPDNSDPYLVFWSPTHTTDQNAYDNIALDQFIDLTQYMEGYTLEGDTAFHFAENGNSGSFFLPFQQFSCGNATLGSVRRAPAYVRLKPCVSCTPPTSAGAIAAPVPAAGTAPFDPGVLNSTASASGGIGGAIVYQWQASIDGVVFTDIAGATGLTYDPGPLQQSTWFRRNARRAACGEWLYATPVAITVNLSGCPSPVSFSRVMHGNASCNPNGDYYFELKLAQVTNSSQVEIDMLPANGLSITQSSLNGIQFSPSAFQSRIQILSGNRLMWTLHPGDGVAQTLRLYYCWAGAYPDPVETTTAILLCSGTELPCSGAGLRPSADDRESAGEGFNIWPNPGSEWLYFSNEGSTAAATMRFINATGQCVQEFRYPDLQPDQINTIDVSALPAGIYFVCLQAGDKVLWKRWERL